MPKKIIALTHADYLIYAVENQDLPTIGYLARLGFSLDTPDRHGTTALTLARYLGDLDTVKILLVLGATPDYHTDPLSHLDYGPSSHAKIARCDQAIQIWKDGLQDPSFSPLLLAIESGNPDFVRLAASVYRAKPSYQSPLDRCEANRNHRLKHDLLHMWYVAPFINLGSELIQGFKNEVDVFMARGLDIRYFEEALNQHQKTELAKAIRTWLTNQNATSISSSYAQFILGLFRLFNDLIGIQQLVDLWDQNTVQQLANKAPVTLQPDVNIDLVVQSISIHGAKKTAIFGFSQKRMASPPPPNRWKDVDISLTNPSQSLTTQDIILARLAQYRPEWIPFFLKLYNPNPNLLIDGVHILVKTISLYEYRSANYLLKQLPIPQQPIPQLLEAFLDKLIDQSRVLGFEVESDHWLHTVLRSPEVSNAVEAGLSNHPPLLALFNQLRQLVPQSRGFETGTN